MKQLKWQFFTTDGSSDSLGVDVSGEATNVTTGSTGSTAFGSHTPLTPREKPVSTQHLSLASIYPHDDTR